MKNVDKLDFSSISMEDSKYLASFHFAFYGLGSTIDWSSEPYDKARAKALSKETGLSEELSKLFFQSCKYEYEEYPFAGQTEAESYDEDLEKLYSQAARFLEVKEFVKGNDEALKFAALSYLNENAMQNVHKLRYMIASNKWRPELYLKECIKNTIIFVIAIALLFAFAFWTELVWLQIIAAIITVLGVITIKGIPKRYAARKQFANYLQQKGAI